MNESKRKSKNKYKAKIEELRVELYPTDADIKKQINKRIAAREPKATYIKRLIREDIEQESLRRTATSFIAKQFNLPTSVLSRKK